MINTHVVCILNVVDPYVVSNDQRLWLLDTWKYKLIAYVLQENSWFFRKQLLSYELNRFIGISNKKKTHKYDSQLFISVWLQICVLLNYEHNIFFHTSFSLNSFSSLKVNKCDILVHYYDYLFIYRLFQYASLFADKCIWKAWKHWYSFVNRNGIDGSFVNH